MSGTIQEALATAEASQGYEESSPIYDRLNKQKPYASATLQLQLVCPDAFEALFMRLVQKDVAKGCIDPDLLCGTLRDHFDVRVKVGESDPDESALWRSLRLPAFLAHLATPLGLVEPEVDEAVISPLFKDGTWTGSLIWDSAVHTCELMLSDGAWRQTMRGATVLELGCGLGLPGWVAHLLGARKVLLTDRGAIADLVRDAIAANPSPPEQQLCAAEFCWSEEGAAALLAEELGGVRPDVILACDCIFAPLFGDAYLLLNMLQALASPSTVSIVALERRPGDGAPAFFAQAAEAGFVTRLLVQHMRIVICELRRGAGG